MFRKIKVFYPVIYGLLPILSALSNIFNYTSLQLEHSYYLSHWGNNSKK